MLRVKVRSGRRFAREAKGARLKIEAAATTPSVMRTIAR